MDYVDTIREPSIELIGTEPDLKQITTSSEIVSDYKSYCREICVNIVADKSVEQIGGNDCIVEID